MEEMALKELVIKELKITEKCCHPNIIKQYCLYFWEDKPKH